MAVNALFKNADSPIDVTSPLMVTFAREEQFEKVRFFISVTPVGIVTEAILVQFSNASSPIEVTVVGIEIVESKPQSLNAPSPIVNRFLRKVAWVKLLFFAKAKLPITVVAEGTLTLPRAQL